MEPFVLILKKGEMEMITHESIEGYKFKQSIKYLFMAFGFLVILNSILITASYIFFKSESSSVGIVDFLRLVEFT